MDPRALSILFEVMAWCRQAASHYLSLCWELCRNMVSQGKYYISRPMFPDFVIEVICLNVSLFFLSTDISKPGLFPDDIGYAVPRNEDRLLLYCDLCHKYIMQRINEVSMRQTTFLNSFFSYETFCIMVKFHLFPMVQLTHLPQCHIYTPLNWAIIGSGNGLSPIRHQAITWTNAGLLSIGQIQWNQLGTNFSEIWIRVLSFSFKKMHLQIPSAKMAAILSRGRWLNNEPALVQILAWCWTGG